MANSTLYHIYLTREQLDALDSLMHIGSVMAMSHKKIIANANAAALYNAWGQQLCIAQPALRSQMPSLINNLIGGCHG